MDWYPHSQAPGLLASTDRYTLRPQHLVTTLDSSSALLLPPHLLHGHRTMGLQAIMRRGLARGHKEGACCPSPLPTAPGARMLLPGHLGFFPPLHDTLPFSSLNQWCEQLDSVWVWGKGRLPWEGPAANMETLPPETGAQGHWTCSSTPPLPHFCASSLFL